MSKIYSTDCAYIPSLCAVVPSVTFRLLHRSATALPILSSFPAPGTSHALHPPLSTIFARQSSQPPHPANQLVEFGSTFL